MIFLMAINLIHNSIIHLFQVIFTGQPQTLIKKQLYLKINNLCKVHFLNKLIV